MIGISIMEWMGCILVVWSIIALFNNKENKHGKDKIRV